MKVAVSEKTLLRDFKKKVREAVANCMYSCCVDYETNKKHLEILGKLLNVPKYSDGSGRNFSKYRKS